MIDVGIVGVGTYLPEKTMKAAEIARLTNGVWSEHDRYRQTCRQGNHQRGVS